MSELLAVSPFMCISNRDWPVGQMWGSLRSVMHKQDSAVNADHCIYLHIDLKGTDVQEPLNSGKGIATRKLSLPRCGY
jgi:hypothetical protein